MFVCCKVCMHLNFIVLVGTNQIKPTEGVKTTLLFSEEIHSICIHMLLDYGFQLILKEGSFVAGQFKRKANKKLGKLNMQTSFILSLSLGSPH